MKIPRHVRDTAVQALRLMASSDPLPAEDAVRGYWPGGSTEAVALIGAALAASVDAGNWREQRAEAAQRLRDGWCPAVRPLRSDGSPSFAEVQRHYHDARKAVPWRGGESGNEMDRIANKQAYLRKVSVEFHRRLKRAGIAVEQ